ncbi:MAG TPA: hypothetical protein DEQ06_07400 [Porphyromonadaceae bacterium]|nr:hypothetical protein [Porphyromonadaceae bacterium]
MLSVSESSGKGVWVEQRKPLSEICYEFGFTNLTNLNRIFKKKKDCTPNSGRTSQNQGDNFTFLARKYHYLINNAYIF